MPCSALTRIIGENIGSKNGVSQQNEESGWDIADTLLGLLHRDCSGWEERNERDSRYAAFYAVACSWGLIWQATGLGNCLLDLHKQDCAYMTGQIWWEDGAYFFLAWPLHLLFLLGLTRASDSCRSSPWLAWCLLFPGLLSRLGMALIPPCSHNNMICCPHLGQNHTAWQAEQPARRLCGYKSKLLNRSWYARKFKIILKQW